MLRFVSVLAIFVASASADIAKTGPSHGKSVICVGNEKSIGISTYPYPYTSPSTPSMFKPIYTAPYVPQHDLANAPVIPIYESSSWLGSSLVEEIIYTLRPLNVDLNLCTHLIYIDANWLSSKDPWDSTVVQGNEQNFVKLREIYPHLNISLSINHSPEEYFKIASNPNNRRRFIRKAHNFIVQNSFDGLDLNWKFGEPSSETFNKEEFVRFVKELKEKFDWDKLTLTSTFGIMKENSVMDIDAIDTFDLVAMSKYFDHMQIHSSNMDIIDTLIKLGIPSQKIIIKLPLFGKLQTTVVELDRDPSYSEKSVTYNEICTMMSERHWEFSFDATNNDKIAKNHRGNEMRVIRYKGSRAIANMVRVAMEKNLLGAMVGIVGDDGQSNCETEEDTYDDFKLSKYAAKPTLEADSSLELPQLNRKYTLVNIVNNAIIAALEGIDQVNESTSDVKLMETTIDIMDIERDSKRFKADSTIENFIQ